MSKTYAQSEEEKNVILNLVQNDELMLCHEIEILQALSKKFNVLNLTDAAKQSGKTYNGMKKRVKSKREVSLELNGKEVISIM